MTEHKKNYLSSHFDKGWTLFLDRDGVINKKRDNDYVKTWEEFEFLPNVLDQLRKWKGKFSRIVVVTNQQGIGKGIMTDEQLSVIHSKMIKIIQENGGDLDAVYYCPELNKDNPECRKPNGGMGHKAKAEFPEIDFEKSIIVGDSFSDMEFGERLNMKRIFIARTPDRLPLGKEISDLQVVSLAELD